MRVFLLGGIAGPVLFAAVVVIAGAMQSDYSHTHHFISELGATGAPHAAIMNYAGFVPAGLLAAGFGFALARVLPRGTLFLASSALVVLFGLGIATSGIISCDLGCPQNGGSAENAIHNGIAPATFLSLIVAAGILATRFRHLGSWRRLAGYSAVSAVVALFLLVALASTLGTRDVTGLWQRFLLFVLFSWCASVSLNAYRTSTTTAKRAQAEQGDEADEAWSAWQLIPGVSRINRTT